MKKYYQKTREEQGNTKTYQMTRLFLFLIAITIFVSFFRLSYVPLFDVDEAVFAEASKEMVESGNWITPTYNESNRYDKPILFYWLIAGSYKVFGINEFGARFPSAIASFLLILSVFLFIRHFRDERNAFYAAISSVLSVYFLVYSHAAVTDIILTLFITLSLFSFYLSVSEGSETSSNKINIYSYGFYLFSSLAFLTKGLIGIVFPFSIAIIYLFITERSIKKAFSLKGAVFFLVISAPWYIAQLAVNGHEFVEQFFIKHHFKRYTGVISGHKGHLYYYIPALIIGVFPWVAFLPAGIINTFKRKENLSLFVFIWFAFIFVFFSLSSTKLPNYILPALPAISILIASGMTVQDEKLLQYSNLFMSVISVLVGAVFFLSINYLLKFNIYDVNWVFLIIAMSVLMAIPGLYTFFTKKTLYGMVSVFMISFLLILLIKGIPVASNYLQGTLYQYSLYAKERLLAGEKVIAYGINNPSLIFYSGHKIISVNSKDELSSLLKGDGRTLAIAKTKDIKVLEESGFSLSDQRDRYAIFEKE